MIQEAVTSLPEGVCSVRLYRRESSKDFLQWNLLEENSATGWKPTVDD